MLIYAVVGLGLMLLSGYTGLFSLGHAAFLGVGAYTEAALGNAGWPFPASFAAAALISAAAGVVVGLPALRVKGIYLAIATLAFGFIVVEVFARWESVTGGNAGKHLKAPSAFGWSADDDVSFYFVCLVVAIGATLAILNLLRSPTGRAFVAIRDSEVSAQSMGIHLARYKTLSFAISAALAGVGGALYAHKLKFISPDQFDIIQSIDLDPDDRRRRHRLGARRVSRRDLPDHDAAGDRPRQGCAARRSSARRPGCRVRSTASS